MDSTQVLGTLVVVLAGFWMGSGGWPIKLLKNYRYEHFGFISMLIGLVILPWLIILYDCPNAWHAYAQVDKIIIVKSNLFSLSWGLANIICFLCFLRIGFSLTGGIMTGVGVSVGVITPMIFKGSGLFENSPDLMSAAGLTVLAGTVVMILGVLLASMAGFGRDRILNKLGKTSGSFLGGLIMAIIAGVISCGISFSFVYSQGPIKQALMAQGAGEIPANFGVWAVGLLAGAVINIIYPAWLMTKNRSWKILFTSKKDFLLSTMIGINFCIAVALMGKGMLLLGALGASVGFGIQQALQMLGGQSVGFISGEWKNVQGTPRRQMYGAILVLIVAAIVMAFGNSLVR